MVTTLEAALATVVVLLAMTTLAFVRSLLTGRLKTAAEWTAVRDDRDFYRDLALRALHAGERAAEGTGPDGR